MVLIPPASTRRHPVDLLLCGHHYLSSRAALAVAGAVVMDETGAIVARAAASNEIRDPTHADIPQDNGSLDGAGPHQAVPWPSDFLLWG